jgi:hypothetical protein
MTDVDKEEWACPAVLRLRKGLQERLERACHKRTIYSAKLIYLAAHADEKMKI